ncbi:MAG: GNAT family N-acetyltransferase [Actinomycetota bacterium]
MEVRQRRPSDLDELVTVAARVRDRDGYPMYLPNDDYVRFLERPVPLAAWVALEDTQLIGHVALNEATSPPVMELVSATHGTTQPVFVARLLVDPAHRGRRIGQTLLERATEAAAALGRPAYLDVVDTPATAPAVALYRRCGWQPLGRVGFDLVDEPIEELVFAAPQADVRTVAGVEIRAAVAGDVAPIEACVADAYAPFAERIGRSPAPMLDDYADLVARGVVHVAVGGDRLRGVIVSWLTDDHLHIDNIATTSEARGSGVGRAMLDWAERRARGAGVEQVRLYTNVAMVENVDYYERRGFVETHRSDDSGYERVFLTKTV